LTPQPTRTSGPSVSTKISAICSRCRITRIALAFEAGRDGFWLARWLAALGVEAHVIHYRCRDKAARLVGGLGDRLSAPVPAVQTSDISDITVEYRPPNVV
jgi:hypothetical protein